MKEIITVILALLGVIALIYGANFAIKWLNKRSGSGTGTSIKVIERYYLGQDKAIVIVKIGEKIMLLGVTGGHIDKIADLDENDIAENVRQSQANGNAFLDNLKKAAAEHQFVKPFIKGKQGEEKEDE